MITLNISKSDTNDQLIVSIENAITRNEVKKSISFGLKDDNSNITNDDVAKFLTNLASLILGEKDSKINYTDEIKNEQSEFIIKLINNFVEAFISEYKKQSNVFQNRINALSNN